MGMDEFPVRKCLAQGSPQSHDRAVDTAVTGLRRRSPRFLGPSFAAPDAILVESEGRQQAELTAGEIERAACRESDLVGSDLERPGD